MGTQCASDRWLRLQGEGDHVPKLLFVIQPPFLGLRRGLWVVPVSSHFVAPDSGRREL